MDGFSALPMPPLSEANRRLHELRVQAQGQRQAAGLPVGRVQQARDDLPWRTNAPTNPTAAETIAALPPHLGWGSEAQTAALRRQLLRQQKANHANNDMEWLECLAAAATKLSTTVANLQNTPPEIRQPFELGSKTQGRIVIRTAHPDGWIKLYPAIGLGMLRQELAAPGRLWLMLRYLDQEGSGVLRIDIIEQLTQKSSTSYLCGKRQLRNLLRDGEGVYWTRSKERIWLRSAAKVACALEVERLTGRPVALPVSALLDGMGMFRAHLYAAFHSGRTKHILDSAYAYPGHKAMPIARETMTKLSGVGRASQRVYEQRTNVQVQANFAVGELATKENQENRAWIQGQALFELKDYRGQQGKQGKTYLAWQLPNTYVGQHQQRPKGRQKRINRELKDLVMKGMPGNIERMNESRQPEKVYYPNDKLAAKVYGRDPKQVLYWRRHRTRNGRFILWQRLGSR